MMTTALGRHLRRVCVLTLAVAMLAVCVAVRAQDDGEPDDPVAIFNQAQDLHERGDLASAIKLYEQALKIAPEFPEAEYQRGMAELARGNNTEAEKAFRRALELRDDWPPALVSLGSLLIDSGQFGKAEELLAKALVLDAQNPAALAAVVELRLTTKASPQALQELLEKVTVLTAKANPTASVWAARAALEAALDKRPAARSSVANALAIDPKHRPSLHLTADMALTDNDIVRTKEAAAALEKLSANTGSLILLKAHIAAAEGDVREVSKLLASLPAGSAKANELRARLASNSEAAAGLEKQLETDPKNAAILGRLCSLLRRDAPQKAVGYCRRASEAEPANLAHVIGYAAALVQAKQFEAAAGVLRKVIEIAPDNSTAHANLATALFELKRYKEAKAEYEWLILKQPNLAAAYLFLALCYDRLGKHLDAMANFQHYLRLADPAANKLEIEKVKLRLSQMQKKK